MIFYDWEGNMRCDIGFKFTWLVKLSLDKHHTY